MANAEKISITITQEMQRQIGQWVAAGEYGNVSEVFRDAYRVLSRERAERESRIAGIKARLQSALEDTRPDLTPEEVDAELDATAAHLAHRYGS